jgi:hypothetical protein
MMMPWNRQTSDAHEPHEFDEGDSLRLLPLWSIIVAILVFVGSQWFFDSAPPPHRRPGSVPMRWLAMCCWLATSAATSNDAICRLRCGF